MTLTDHVPTLETCKSLDEAGFPQDSTLFLWKWNPITTHVPKVIRRDDEIPNTPWETCAAPTLTELLDQLPESLNVDSGFQLLTVGKHGAGYESIDGYGQIIEAGPNVVNDNIQEAAALLWLELLDES